ncbi:MAG: S9 family peptidase [Thermoanaerobaculia bacterium]
MTPKTLILASSRLLLVCLALILLPANSDGQESDTGDANGIDAKLRRIFTDEEFEPEEFGPARWQDDGAYYTTLEPSDTVKDSKDEEAKDIVRYETTTGLREVVIEAGQLVPEGRSRALEIDDYAWSEDKKRLLIFTNTERVWRRNTRGDYWVMDLATGDLRQLGGDAAPSTLMFAKFSPDGTQVAYVQGHNLHVEEIDGGSITPLTRDGSETIINGTSDWVYEEEFGIRDGFRWSPDGRHIAFWNFDSSGVDEFALINNTDTLYPEITLIPYPKAGTTNSAARIGVVGATGGEIRWMDVPGDSRNTYIARMDWCDDSETLILQHLNRLQNTNDVLLADTATGKVRRAHQDRSDTWVDVMDDLEWLEGSEEFVWLSEKDGWRHAYRVRRDGGGEKLITPFEADVISLVGTGSGAEWLYFIASPDNATQRFLYRAKVDGSGRPERVTPTDQPGSHSYDLSPDGAYAFHTYSRFDVPPVVDLVRLPEHETVRVLEDNSALASKLSDIVQPPVEFFQTEVEPGFLLDSWMLKPRDLEPSQSYPLLVFVYGEPAGTTVVDRWGGERMLFHRALADEGFVVVSFDNRGTPAPKGAAWRKVVYGTVGEHSSRDQAAAVRAFSRKHSFVDPERVAVWGWSGGGSNTLNCMFRYPEVFKVGVSVAPVPDQRLYDTIYQERYMGLPDDNARGYEIGSPIHFAAGLEGRLLLVHGTADANVHYQGTERLVNRLIELGKPFDMMVYPNRTHAIKEGDGTRFHVYSLIARYLTEARW